MMSRLLRSAGACALVTIAALFARPASAQDRDRADQRTLEGTWSVRVTLADCTSGTPMVSFSALLTFAKGGTITGTTSNPGFAAGQRSPDHGVWFPEAAAHTYRASSVALVLFTTAPNLPMTPGIKAGSQRLDQTIVVTDPDQFTSDAVTQFFDAAGQKYRDGCATAIGRRFE